MSKERYNQIIDEAYTNFVNSVEKNREEDYTRPVISKEEFVSEIKFHRDFSEKWGLKIEERELNMMEAEMLSHENSDITWEEAAKLIEPTKLITLTYNNETIEIYE